MAAATPPLCDFGWPAPAFTLPATDGRALNLQDVAGPNGLLLMFSCNHCPFVLAILGKIERDARDLSALGIGVAAICSNDAKSYPADSFPNMVKMAEDRDWAFPYLHDESQDVARAYDAVCTPDFFGFNAALELQYRGRLDAQRAGPAPDDLPRELYAAMKQVAETGKCPEEQVPSMGCSIKWAS
ncbi:MAG: thioredoxin family protein [Pseudomonadota bacterium]